MVKLIAMIPTAATLKPAYRSATSALLSASGNGWNGLFTLPECKAQWLASHCALHSGSVNSPFQPLPDALRRADVADR